MGRPAGTAVRLGTREHGGVNAAVGAVTAAAAFAASIFAELSLTDALIVAGMLGFVAVKTVEVLGWSRSANTLRVENDDLLRRNKELEETLGRHELEIGRLTALVEDLQKRDQAAVLHVLEKHEQNAANRHSENATRHAEMRGLLEQIRDRLPLGR